MLKSLRFALFSTSLLASMSAPAYAVTLEEALTATYESNPQILAERQRQQATDEGVSQAVSGFRPSITGSYSDGRQKTNFANAGDINSDYQTKALRVEQPLFRGGGTWSSYQAAKQRVRTGQYQLQGVEQQVLLQAVTAYMDVVSARSILDLSRNNQQVLDQQLKAANVRFQVGEVTRTDVAQSEARLSDAKTAVISAEGQLLSAMASYERVVGARPQGTLIMPDNLPELPASLDEALERGRAANPQLLAAIHATKAANYDVDTTTAALLPRASLVGTLSNQEGAGSAGNSNFDQNRIGVEVTIPLYQSGAEWSRVREASAIARQNSHNSIDQRMITDASVIQNWEQLETATATIVTRNDQIKAAALALDGVKQEQQYGSRTVLDVLDAEQELFTARTNLVRAERDRIVTAYNLAFVLGQLTPNNLGLKVNVYDPQEHADDVDWQMIGF